MKKTGTRYEVMYNRAHKTGGGLIKKDLKLNKYGKIISKKLSKINKIRYKNQFGGVVENTVVQNPVNVLNQTNSQISKSLNKLLNTSTKLNKNLSGVKNNVTKVSKNLKKVEKKNNNRNKKLLTLKKEVHELEQKTNNKPLTNNNKKVAISNNKVSTNNNKKVETVQNNKNNNVIVKRNINLNRNKLFEKIGILDPEGIANNPLTGEPYKNLYYTEGEEISRDNFTYQSLAKMWSGFPMYQLKEQVLEGIYNNNVILVISGTGSGKTVLTPKFALHAMNYNAKIAITNPKRIPTISNAKFAAMCLDVEIGGPIGIKHRGSEKSYYSKESKLIYCTDGYISARLDSDPLLMEFDCVIVDEAHERNMRIDLLLLLLKDVLLARPTFKLIIMSATINDQVFVDYYEKDKKFSKKCNFLKINAGEKPNHPIKEFFSSNERNYKLSDNGIVLNKDEFVERATKIAFDILKKHEKGDLLIFLCSGGDGNTGEQALRQMLRVHNANSEKKLFVSILTGSSPESNKNYAESPKYYINNGYTRKVIFATEVAESSMTFDGVDFVIDTGLAYTSQYYPKKDIGLLETRRISKASHNQRRGRTGRTAPGTCYNLFSQIEFNSFDDYTTAPVLNDNINEELLKFLARKDLVSHIDLPLQYKKKVNRINNKLTKDKNGNLNLENRALPFLDYLQNFIQPPKLDAVQNIVNKINKLGGFNSKDGKLVLNDLGEGMAAFGLTPEWGRALIESYNYRCRDEMCNFAGFVSITKGQGYANIFQRFKPKSKNRNEINKEKKEYEKMKDKWTSMYGDFVSFTKLYKEFSKHRYDKTRRNGSIITPKLGDAGEWCTKHKLKKGMLDKIKDEAKQLQRKFGIVVGIDRRNKKNSNIINKSFIFQKPLIDISDKLEERLVIALSLGFAPQFLIKAGKMYRTCSNIVNSQNPIERDSPYGKIKNQYKYGVYISIDGFNTRSMYTLLSPISENMLNKLKKYEHIVGILEDCDKKNNLNLMNKSNGKKSKKWQKGRKGKKSRKGKKEQKKKKRKN